MVLVFGYPALIFLGYLVSCPSLLQLFVENSLRAQLGDTFYSLSFLVFFGFIFWRGGLEIMQN